MPFGFVYLWRDKLQKRFYLGSHFGAETDRYVGGSKRMIKEYRKRKGDFKRRIICRAIVQSHVELKEIEQGYLDLIKPWEFGTRYYNLSAQAYGADPARASEWMKGNKHGLGKKPSAEARQKISERQKGVPKPAWLIERQRLGRIGRRWYTNGTDNTLSKTCPEGWRPGRCEAFRAALVGFKHGHGAKISESKRAAYAAKRASFGFACSPETRAKISATKRAKKDAVALQ